MLFTEWNLDVHDITGLDLETIAGLESVKT